MGVQTGPGGPGCKNRENNPMQSSCQDDRAWINRPALANAWRPYSSLPFHTDHA
jgi:hypothetical protein